MHKWKPRLLDYPKSLVRLAQAIEAHQNDPSNFIKDAVFYRFRSAHKLAWKLLRDYLQYEGYQDITGSRTATRLAFNVGLIKDGETWMAMIETRNRTVHAYDESVLHIEFQHIIENYFEKLTALLNIMQQKSEEI